MDLLDKGEWLGNLSYSPDERVMLDECQLLAAKPVLLVANVSEETHTDEALVNKVREFAEKRGARVVTICGQLEAEPSSSAGIRTVAFSHRNGPHGNRSRMLNARDLYPSQSHYLLHGRRGRIPRVAAAEGVDGTAGGGKDPLRHGTRLHPSRGLSLR